MIVDRRGRIFNGVSPKGTHSDISIRTSNDREAQCARELEADGYTIFKRGWPDILAVKDGEVRMIEVKPPGGRLKPTQQKVADALESAGIHVEVWHSAA